MTRGVSVLSAVLLWSLCISPAVAGNAYGRWSNGPDKGEAFFPIEVWLQNPAKAPQ